MNRRSGTCQVVDLVDLDEERKGDVVAQQLEIRLIQQVCDVVALTGVEIVDAQDFMPLCNQALAQVASKEARSTSDQDAQRRGKGHRNRFPSREDAFSSRRTYGGERQ